MQKHADRRQMKPNREKTNQNGTNESDEPSSESKESSHHIKEIKNIDETNKHFTTTQKINGVMKEFIIDTGSLISLMPPDERIMRSIEMQKKSNRYQDVNKNV